MDSIMFHTGACVPNKVTGKDPVWYHDFLNTFWICKVRRLLCVCGGGARARV